MTTTLQNIMLGEELLNAVRLCKTGLRELNRMNGATDFFHLPILMLASGIERFMKTIICCHHLSTEGEFPKKNIFLKGRSGHDLILLLDHIINKCFSEKYVSQIPAAKKDIDFLRNNTKIKRIVQILSDFGQSARYYNLNVVLGYSDPGPSPDEEWQKLEMEILKEDPQWTEKIADPSQSASNHAYINTNLTVNCEKLIRSLSRLFTIGGLGDYANSISVHTHHFLFLNDSQLGKTNYENIHI